MVKKTLALLVASTAILTHSIVEAGYAQNKIRDLGADWSWGNGGWNNKPMDYTKEEMNGDGSSGGADGGSGGKTKKWDWGDWSWDDGWKKHFDWKKCGVKEPEEEPEVPVVPVPDVPVVPDMPSGNQSNATYSCMWVYNATCK